MTPEELAKYAGKTSDGRDIDDPSRWKLMGYKSQKPGFLSTYLPTMVSFVNPLAGTMLSTAKGVAEGADIGDLAKNAAINYAAGQAGQYVSGLDSLKDVTSGLGDAAVKSAVSTATKGALTGNLSLDDIITNAVMGGATSGLADQLQAAGLNKELATATSKLITSGGSKVDVANLLKGGYNLFNSDTLDFNYQDYLPSSDQLKLDIDLPTGDDDMSIFNADDNETLYFDDWDTGSDAVASYDPAELDRLLGAFDYQDYLPSSSELSSDVTEQLVKGGLFDEDGNLTSTGANLWRDGVPTSGILDKLVNNLKGAGTRAVGNMTSLDGILRMLMTYKAMDKANERIDAANNFAKQIRTEQIAQRDNPYFTATLPAQPSGVRAAPLASLVAPSRKAG